MRRSKTAAIAVFAMLVGLSGGNAGSLAAPPRTPTDTLGCASPAGPRDTAAVLSLRFGGRVRLEQIAGADGETLRALVIFPADSRRRLEVVFADRAMTRPASVTVRAPGSIWSLAGLHIGSTVERVNLVNRSSFAISGFAWDYGGYARDFGGGALDRMPGGCQVTIRFRPNSNRLETNLLGERSIASNSRGLGAARATISEMAIRWPNR